MAMVKSMSSTSTMDTSDDSSRYMNTGSTHHHGGAPSPKSYEKYILEVQSIMQRRLERAASQQQPSIPSTSFAEQEVETEIVHQLLSNLQQANHSSQAMIHNLQQDLVQSKSEVVECKSKIHQLSKRCTVAEMELKELRIAIIAASSNNSSGSGSPTKKSYYKRSSTGTSVTKTITDKSLYDEGEEECCDYINEEEGLEGGFPKVIGIPSHQDSSAFREWMNKSASTPSSSSELLQGVEPIVEQEQEDGEDEHALDESSRSSSSTIYSPLIKEFDEQMASLLERRKVVTEFMGGDKAAVKELDEQMAALLNAREIIKSLHDACDGLGGDETEDVLKEEDHHPPLDDLGDNSSSTGDVSIDEQYPKDTPQRRLSDYGGALTPIFESPDEPTPEPSSILPRQNNNEDLAQLQQQPSPSPVHLCSNILDNSNIGTRYDSRGRCINHPHVQLRKKKKRSLLLSKGSSPSKKSNSKEVEWKIKYNSCPDCCIEHLIMLGQEVVD